MEGGIGWQRWRLRRERELFAERERRTLAQARDELERNVELRTHDLMETNRLLSDEIEERRRAEENLRQTRDELIQAAKLAVLGQLAAGINHELNQPLAAIRAYAENARTFLERQRLEAADANLAQVVELTERMAEISAQLRQFSRKSSSSLTAVSVQACFRYALRLYQNRLHDVEVEDERVFIGVSDSGPGIPEVHLARIFEPFFTTKSPGSGLGLGLSISARIIRDLSGNIDASNVPGAGARFTITLPRMEQPDDAQPSPIQEQQSHA